MSTITTDIVARLWNLCNILKVEHFRVQKGDLLVTRTGSIGVMAVFEDDYLAIPSAYLIRFRFSPQALSRDVLDASFRQWLGDFSAWFKMRMGIADPGDAEVLDAMRTYAEYMALIGFKAREFLQSPVFQMLHRHCAAGDQRVLALMKNVVTMAVPLA